MSAILFQPVLVVGANNPECRSINETHYQLPADNIWHRWLLDKANMKNWPDSLLTEWCAAAITEGWF